MNALKFYIGIAMNFYESYIFCQVDFDLSHDAAMKYVVGNEYMLELVLSIEIDLAIRPKPCSMKFYST